MRVGDKAYAYTSSGLRRVVVVVVVVVVVMEWPSDGANGSRGRSYGWSGRFGDTFGSKGVAKVVLLVVVGTVESPINQDALDLYKASWLYNLG